MAILIQQFIPYLDKPLVLVPFRDFFEFPAFSNDGGVVVRRDQGFVFSPAAFPLVFLARRLRFFYSFEDSKKVIFSDNRCLSSWVSSSIMRAKVASLSARVR